EGVNGHADDDGLIRVEDVSEYVGFKMNPVDALFSEIGKGGLLGFDLVDFVPAEGFLERRLETSGDGLRRGFDGFSEGFPRGGVKGQFHGGLVDDGTGGIDPLDVEA